MNRPKIGILGGGQLGRMLFQAGINLDFDIHILDPNEIGPSSHLCANYTIGDFNNYNDVVNFGQNCDIITIEIEHVNIDALKMLQASGKKIFPQPEVLEIIQDKGLQKSFYANNNIPTSAFQLVDDVAVEWNKLTKPFVQKLRTGGYDGRGVALIKNNDNRHKVLPGESIIEELIEFEKEIAVIVSRSSRGEVKTFPVVEMEFNPEANLVEFLHSPANISVEIKEKARQLAVLTAEKMNIIGTLAVEMFLLRNGQILVNECAPRVHNSGHHTIEANAISQFEQHLRAICGMPLGDTQAFHAAVMVNILGAENHSGAVFYQGLEKCLEVKGVYPHIYGKTHTNPFRKMGHVTIIDNSLNNAKEKARWVLNNLKCISQ